MRRAMYQPIQVKPPIGGAGEEPTMTVQKALAPAEAMAARCHARFPNESAEYREARTALLAEEIELRRHIERVAAQRRALPPGGAVDQDYRFEGEAGPVTLAAAVRRQGHADRLQLHVRTAARDPLPDVHLADGVLGGQDAGHHAADGAGDDRALADRTAGRGEGRARLDPAAGLFRRHRRVHPRLRQSARTPTFPATTCSPGGTA